MEMLEDVKSPAQLADELIAVASRDGLDLSEIIDGVTKIGKTIEALGDESPAPERTYFHLGLDLVKSRIAAMENADQLFRDHEPATRRYLGLKDQP